MVSLRINGETRNVDAPPDMPLLWALRDILGLTGTKFGCGIAQCGACTVHVDGAPVRSCLLPVGSIGQRAITTIEGIGTSAVGAKVQKAWIEMEVVQCGYCQSGRIVSAVDTGIVVNPDTVVAQLQGGLIFGLTAALYGKITIDKGRVQQSNFNDYRMLRINEIPQIEVHLIKSGEAPGGIGETGATAAPPALGNALFAAIGIRLRQLSIDRDVLSGKKPSLTTLQTLAASDVTC